MADPPPRRTSYRLRGEDPPNWTPNTEPNQTDDASASQQDAQRVTLPDAETLFLTYETAIPTTITINPTNNTSNQ